jgi:hypothetical protein
VHTCPAGRSGRGAGVSVSSVSVVPPAPTHRQREDAHPPTASTPPTLQYKTKHTVAQGNCKNLWICFSRALLINALGFWARSTTFVLKRAPGWCPCHLVFGQTPTSLRCRSTTNNQSDPLTAGHRRRESTTLTCDIGNVLDHGGPDLSRERAVPDTLEHDESRTGDCLGGRLAAGRPDQWVEGSVHNQGRQP